MDDQKTLTTLNLEYPIWDQIYSVHPLVVIGTHDSDGEPNFAPKHMAFPIGWGNYFGFVCTPKHKTYQNIKETGEFTVTYPKPDQVVTTSLTATAREENDEKPFLKTVETFDASEIESPFMKGGYFYLECRLMRFVDDFDENSLILSEVVAAHAESRALRKPSKTDQESLYVNPQIAYISPGRFAVIRETQAFPFPKQFVR